MLNSKSFFSCIHSRTIRTVIGVWMDSYPDDFREHPNFPCLRHIVTFCNKHMKESELAKRAQQKIDNFIKEEEPVGPVGGELE